MDTLSKRLMWQVDDWEIERREIGRPSLLLEAGAGQSSALLDYASGKRPASILEYEAGRGVLLDCRVRKGAIFRSGG